MTLSQEKDILKEKMDNFVHIVYHCTKSFPKDELYGVTSQLRRAALSIILNYIEGFARLGTAEHSRFLQIAYASLKETKYLLFFSHREVYLSPKQYQELLLSSEEIGAMLWSKIKTINKKK